MKRGEIRSSGTYLAPRAKSAGIGLPVPRWGGRRTNRLGSVLRRHLCLEIGRRGGARGAVLLTFVSSVHNPKIMLGMLIKVLCRDSIATRSRLPRESNVTFEDLMRGAADFDVRTVTIEILTSRRYLLPIAVGIITVVTTIWSAGLSCSHDTLCIDAEVGLLTKENHRNTFISRTRRAAFSVQRLLSRAGTLDGLVVISNSFLAQCPPKPTSAAPPPWLKLAGSRTRWLRQSPSSVVRMPSHCYLMSEFEKS